MNDLAAELMAVIADVAKEPQPIDRGTDLLLSGIIDSLGVVLVVGWLEERLGIGIDAADVTLEHFGTVDAMVRYVERRPTSAA